MVTRSFVLGPEFDLAPDDTEETLVGSTSHQGAIVALNTSLAIYIRREQLPWLVGNQLTIVVPRGPGKPPYQPSPDILVHLTLGGVELQSLNVAEFGPPALAIEVTSPATARSRDLNLRDRHGKPALYEAMGVLEYLVFDPPGDYSAEQVRAWRRGMDGLFAPWLPDATHGRWVSEALGGISFGVQGTRLRAYDPQGRLLPTVEELDEQGQALRLLNQQLAERVAALEAELRRRGE